MKIFVINLDSNVERMRAVDKQLSSLGVKYERCSAIYGKNLAFAIKMQSIDRFRWWCAMGRPIRDGEIGCALSHYEIYKQMTDSAVCVLEDDVILSQEFTFVLSSVESWIDVKKPQVVLLSNHTRHVGEGIVRCTADKYTEGYVITPKAAKALLGANLPMQVPCDHWGRWVSLGLIELYHAYPTVCSQDQSQYESSIVDKGCFDVKNLKPVPFILHKLKRLVGKTIDWSMLKIDVLNKKGA